MGGGGGDARLKNMRKCFIFVPGTATAVTTVIITVTTVIIAVTTVIVTSFITVSAATPASSTRTTTRTAARGTSPRPVARLSTLETFFALFLGASGPFDHNSVSQKTHSIAALDGVLGVARVFVLNKTVTVSFHIAARNASIFVKEIFKFTGTNITGETTNEERHSWMRPG
jgi:hypothetical protein